MKPVDLREVEDLSDLADIPTESFEFSLSEHEQKKFKSWRDAHDRACRIRDEHTAIGGRFTFAFTQTSIGDVIKVKCACGAEIEVTDYDRW